MGGGAGGGGGGCSPPVFAKFLQNLPFLPQALAFLCLQPPHVPVSPCTFKFTPPSMWLQYDSGLNEDRAILTCLPDQKIHQKSVTDKLVKPEQKSRSLSTTMSFSDLQLAITTLSTCRSLQFFSYSRAKSRFWFTTTYCSVLNEQKKYLKMNS